MRSVEDGRSGSLHVAWDGPFPTLVATPIRRCASWFYGQCEALPLCGRCCHGDAEVTCVQSGS